MTLLRAIELAALVALATRKGEKIMDFTLQNYDGALKKFVLEKVEDIKDLILIQLSGDECLIVTYTDGEQTMYDPCDFRSISAFDSAKTISLQELEKLHKHE